MAAIYAAAAADRDDRLMGDAEQTCRAAGQGGANALASPRNMQIAMLIEAVMLGYSMARKTPSK